MNRYSNTPIDKRYDGRNVYLSTSYPDIPVRESDIYITSRDGDRLDLISNQYYKTPSLWWVIAIANNLNGSGIHVPGGIQIRIPSDLQQVINSTK